MQTGRNPIRGERFLLITGWVILAAILMVVFLVPFSNRTTRLAAALLIPALWLGGIALLGRRSLIARLLTVATALLMLFLAWPGRPWNIEALQKTYLRSLRQYEGVEYIWGGESVRGIDCSGLIRRGMIDSQLQLGARSLNPRLIRMGLATWWHDCTAKALRDHYRGIMRDVTEAAGINSIPESMLQAGDVAITQDGVHILAYLGDASWIQADPGSREVVVLRTPADNPWFGKPVKVMRWKLLE